MQGVLYSVENCGNPSNFVKDCGKPFHNNSVKLWRLETETLPQYSGHTCENSSTMFRYKNMRFEVKSEKRKKERKISTKCGTLPHFHAMIYRVITFHKSRRPSTISRDKLSRDLVYCGPLRQSCLPTMVPIGSGALKIRFF